MNKTDPGLLKREKKGRTPIVCQVLRRETLKGKKNRKIESVEWKSKY